MDKKLIISIGVLALAIVMYSTFRITGNVVATKMIDEDIVIKFPLDTINKNAEFFYYRGIEFFVVRAKDGSVKTAFNACDICYKSKKGYR